MSISSDEAHSDMDLSVSSDEAHSDSSCVESDTDEETGGDESQDDTPPPDLSSDEKSFCFNRMDDEEDDYDSSTSDDDEDILLFDKSDRKKPPKKKSANKPCFITGCVKQGKVAIDDGILYCISHARTEAPEAYNRWRQQKSCTILGCDKEGRVVSGNGRYCEHHAKTEAPETYARYRQRVNSQRAERYRTNPKLRIELLARGRLRYALKAQGTSYRGKNKLLGCTVDQFKRYLEQFFSDPGNRWMNWDNHGRIEGVRCWEMDHIRPLASFKNLKDPEQLRRAQHWSNFQPLSAADNGSGGKGADIPDGFEWNGDRWMWTDDCGRTNYDLPE